MAKIILDSSGKEVEIEEGSGMIKECEEEFNILFGCKEGICGTCVVEIVEGLENLNDKNEKENGMSKMDNERFICQCKIKKGVVRIKY